MNDVPVTPCRKAFDVENGQVLSARTSSAMACDDRNESPMPAITACLIVSLLMISIAARDACGVRSRMRPASNEKCPEPSPNTNGFLQQSLAIWRMPTSGWPGAATITYACGAKAARAGVGVVGRADHDREVGQVVGELAQQGFAIVDREVERHARMLLGECGQQAREEIVAGADHRDVEPPRAPPLSCAIASSASRNV